MLIVMKPKAGQDEIRKIVKFIEDKGFKAHISEGEIQTIIGAIGEKPINPGELELFDGVQKIMKITANYKLASRELQAEDTIIDIRGIKIGGDNFAVIAGPCSVESFDQMDEVAKSIKATGVNILRGGAFKPRTSPYSFQGMGEEGLKILREVADKYDMLVASEIMEISQISVITKYVDLLQVGARNMQNFNLLRELGYVNKPIILKRGLSATIEEWLMSAEYIMAGGNKEVILCERGIRTFEKATRNTLDISAIPVIKKISHLPIIADPSHATGLRDKVLPLSRAILAAGADGLMVEVHNNPEKALCDGAQSLYPNQFESLMGELKQIASIVNKKI